MKKSIKIGIILIVLLATVFAVNVRASSLSWDSIKQSADAFEQAGNRNQLIKDDTIVKAVVPVGQMLTAIGVAVLFGSLLIIGIKYMMADAEIICLGYDFLTGMGIKDITLRINSVGCPECRRKHREALKAFLEPKYDQLCDTCKDRYERNPMRIIDCKSPICQELIKGAPMMVDYLCDDCRSAFDELQQNLNSMDIPFEIDPTIVRGLDYYTKTAFEFVTNSLGAQGTVCGGGRYDHLVEEVGGPPIPGVGFGLGIERLIMLMEANGAEFPEEEGVDVFIAVMGEAAKAYGQKLAREFRQKGLCVQMDTLARNIKGQFKYADRLNARYTVVIGDNELKEGVVSLKDMSKSEQRQVKFEDLYEEVRRK